MATAVLTFVIVGHDDHPIFEADLSRAEGREGVSLAYCTLSSAMSEELRAAGMLTDQRQPALLQDRAQYLHQFVLHAALDAVDEQVWVTSSMHLGVVDKFNNLQVGSIDEVGELSPGCPSSSAVWLPGSMAYCWRICIGSTACRCMEPEAYCACPE